MAKKHQSDRVDIYQRVTDQIIAAIESGVPGKWEMPWHQVDDPMSRPINVERGHLYRGVNVISLWAEGFAKGYNCNLWGTYRQWQEKGAQVRKGEKASLVVFWKFPGKEEEAQDESAESECPHRAIVARGYPVFNALQVDGFEIPTRPELPRRERIETAEEFFRRTGAEIRHGGNQAYYKQSSDHIQMPIYEAFPDPICYYATLAHELTHWTGHESRLQRDLKGRFGSESYAAEELIAELGAAFLCADLGLTNEPREDHACYIASWLKVLKEDNRAIFTAASHAQRAVDFVHEPASPGIETRILSSPAKIPLTSPKLEL